MMVDFMSSQEDFIGLKKKTQLFKNYRVCTCLFRRKNISRSILHNFYLVDHTVW